MAQAPPRTFKLLMELNGADHGELTPLTTLGLVDPNCQDFTEWIGSVMGQFGNFENRMYQIRFTCGEDYPEEPPTVTFVQCVALPEVNSDGEVAVDQLDGCDPWDPTNMGMKDILNGIVASLRNNRGIEQPAEDSKYINE